MDDVGGPAGPITLRDLSMKMAWRNDGFVWHDKNTSLVLLLVWRCVFLVLGREVGVEEEGGGGGRPWVCV